MAALRAVLCESNSLLSPKYRGSRPQAEKDLRSARRAVFLEIDFNVGLRPGAADQDIPFSRRIKRFRFVLNRAGNECGFATVAHACTAGPADWNPAGFSEFEKALELATPGPGDTAPNERNLRTRASHGPRRFRTFGSSDAGCVTLTGPKGFAVDLSGLDAPFFERGAETSEEVRWTANIEVGFAGNAELIEGRNG